MSISSGDDSGLATTDGTSIFLFDEDGVIEGRVGDETGDVAFSISIASDTGEVTLTQYLSLYHSDATDNDDPMFLADGVIKAVVTVTDGDGDEDDAEVDISGLFTFEDDGPTAISVVEYLKVQVPVDDVQVGQLEAGWSDADGTRVFCF